MRRSGHRPGSAEVDLYEIKILRIAGRLPEVQLVERLFRSRIRAHGPGTISAYGRIEVARNWPEAAD